jgi:hypothetical protein
MSKPTPPALSVPEALAYLERICNGSGAPGGRRRPHVLHYTPIQVTATAPAEADPVTAVVAGDDRRYEEKI